MAGELDPLLRQAIARGLMTEGEALDVDAMADGLTQAVIDGTLSLEEAGRRAAERGKRDAIARNRKDQGKP